jgi:aquaporin Z
MQKLVGEALGTFILVVGGCGAAVFAANFAPGGIGLLGVAFAFGLAVLAGVYAIGPISGAHFNPAVSLGLACAGRFPWRAIPAYVAAQLTGATIAALVIYGLAAGQPGGYSLAARGLAANGFAAHSPGHYSFTSCLGAEIVLTFVFVSVILGVTSHVASTAIAGIAIGFTLTLVHLIGIPITNLSVNPARSTGPALLVGDWAIRQLWLFWLAPLCGGGLAGAAARWVQVGAPEKLRRRGEPERTTSIPGRPIAT